MVAVSGGLDSTTLAHLLHAEGYFIVIAHCNYHLRGEESDRDEAAVKALAETLGVPLAVGSFPLRKSDGNVQLRAREIRYTYFKKILDEYSCDLLVTAHHADDALESLLFHLIRGTGLPGIRGIPSRTDFPLVRPLLSSSRSQILEYARQHGLTWREDASNQSDDYARNRIRHHLVPRLQEMGLTPEGASTTLGHLRSAEFFYLRGLASVAETCLRRQGGRIVFDRRTELLTFTDTLTLLHHHTAYMGFGDDAYRQMLTVTGNRIIPGRGYRARVSPAEIVFEPGTPESAAEEPVQVHRLPFTAELPGGRIELAVTDRPRVLSGADQYCRLPELPLLLRPRRAGDRMQPFGMQGSKKIQDILVDDKVAIWERDDLRLLCTPAGSIVAIVGHRIADDWAVGEQDDRVLRIRLQKGNPALP
nr:tRNA lysidine(34) synthetase TilS [Lewinella sp. JB7]